TPRVLLTLRSAAQKAPIVPKQTPTKLRIELARANSPALRARTPTYKRCPTLPMFSCRNPDKPTPKSLFFKNVVERFCLALYFSRHCEN
ncbi:unnamed protein product, partial [Calicophoron daubneyi]